MAVKRKGKSKEKEKPLKKICDNCKKELILSKFYNTSSPFSKDGKVNICKICTEDMMDYDDITTIYKVLQLMDLPFFYKYWQIASEKNPNNPWGTYIRIANSKMNEFKNATYSDSVFEEQEEVQKEPRGVKHKGKVKEIVVEDETYEKWGYGYQNEEYIAFEKKYNSLKDHYREKTAMHTEALLKYIRYSVKEEMSTAKGDVSAAKSWGALAQDAAKAAKIQPQQLSVADLQDGLSTFGQLVRAVEKAVDVIDIVPKFKERPQDSPDFTLWCYINYVRDLKGLPLCDYKEIYEFYEIRKREYENTSKSLRETLKNEAMYEDETVDDGDIDG